MHSAGLFLKQNLEPMDDTVEKWEPTIRMR